MKAGLFLDATDLYYHNVRGRSDDGGQHVDTVCGEISPLFGSVVGSVGPA